jgi:hypothetical protein
MKTIQQLKQDLEAARIQIINSIDCSNEYYSAIDKWIECKQKLNELEPDNDIQLEQ